MILISPWGDPRKWEETNYIYNNAKLKSKTSLKILQEILKPEKTLIIGFDTLANNGNNYSELKNNVKVLLEKSVKKSGLENTEILIAPGKGYFSNGIFEGNMMDYYYYILWKLSETLLKSNIPEEIHLDLTHGINFMPVLTYRAVKQVLGLLSIFKRNIKLRVYNADPFIPNLTDELLVNVVEDSVVIPIPFRRKIRSYRIVKSESLSSKETNNLFANELAVLKKLKVRDISAFLSSIYNGLPLVLCSFYPDTSLLESSIQDSTQAYKRHIRVSKESTKLRVRKPLRFTEDFEACVMAYLTARLVTENIGIKNQTRELNLNQLRIMNNCIFSYDKRLEERIDNEIAKINKIKSIITSNWRILGKSANRKFRHFLAHSGFEKNAVEWKKECGEIFFRYKIDEMDTIKNYCLESMI